MTETLTALVGVDVETELKHEESLLADGQQQYRDRVVRRVEKGQETLMDYGKQLVARTIDPLANAITAFMADSQLGAGRKHTASRLLANLSPDVIAFITAQVVFDRITIRSVYQAVAGDIGRRVEDETRFAAFSLEKPRLYDKVMENLKKSPEGYRRINRRKTLVHAANKFSVVWQKWTHADHLHVGSKLIELLIQSTGLVRLARSPAVRNTKIYLEATPELTALLVKVKGKAEFMHPHWQPMLRPPKLWSNLDDGGYESKRLHYPLVKSMNRGHVAELNKALMPDVYQSVNALQNTPWKVNQELLDTVHQVWDAGMMLKGLPPKVDVPLPIKPEPPLKGEGLTPRMRAWIKYKNDGANVFNTNLRFGSKRAQVIKILSLAEKYRNAEAIWFPIRLDFRGRMYSVPQYLSPQGTDLAKALLLFAEGKAIDERGEFWLAVHLANTFGEDKIGLEARASWTKQNSYKIEEVGNDPLNNTWWMQADKPFQFLAACLEWNAYLAAKYQGETFISHLPVMVDGSCNGLQHFAAMLRDEVSGAAVNLVPADKPADIYQRVADEVRHDLLSNTFEVATDKAMAQQWLDYGVDRKLAKRPTMVLPYGGTREAVRTYLLEFVLTQAAEHEKNPEEGRANPFADAEKAVSFLAPIMWNVMGRVVVGPMEAMRWLRKAAQTASKEGLPLGWTTPTGFIVQQAYPDLERRRVKTKIGDEIVKFTILEPKSKDGLAVLNKRKQATALAPNFVHSLDAAALMLTINLAVRLGVSAFAAVHDAYGTHAADMDALQACLRDVFVEMYENSDVLDQFAQQLLAVERMKGKELPPLPPKGNLDLAGIRQSDFFFA